MQNVSVGFGALGNVSIAFGNVVIGANGLSNIAAPTTAIQNVVIGQSAGNNLGVGGGASVETNTLIGTNCALNLFGASSKNTWIGGFQGPSLALNNTIAIGTGTIAAELLDLNLSTTHIWTFGAVQSGQTPTGLHVYNIQDTNSLGLSSLIINYERAVFDWTNTSNVLVIGTQAAGTGSTRNLKFIIGGINKQDYGITNAGVWTVAQTTMVATSLTLTDGSSTSVATLTNGPATGNPTKWVPINDNGTTRYIPAW